ncbi:hypothetical protein FHEFKHOI_00774 [Candidatus Methanoperedenaceae archaeon GB50]|nr:hypothetical protein FHEFKHOI_00774 [Candidatus Methanoperedenaceae archaeon GB50]CAD7772349.1 MAG: hypothetical protein KBONHNOK_00532 [Candidatus Methanoperedenaceae archaeon GB50]
MFHAWQSSCRGCERVIFVQILGMYICYGGYWVIVGGMDMKCESCGKDAEKLFDEGGKKLCEECYMDLKFSDQSCCCF